MLPLALPKAPPLTLVAVNFAAKLECSVFPAVRETWSMNWVIESGPWNFGHLKAPRPGTKAPAKPMRGKSSGVRSAHPSIQCRRQTRGYSDRREAWADTGGCSRLWLHSPSCACRSPDPVASDHLSSRMDDQTAISIATLGKSSTVPELLPKKYMPLMRVVLIQGVKSTLAITLSTPTSFGKTLHHVDRFDVLLIGKPVPLQVTVPLPDDRATRNQLAGVADRNCRFASEVGDRIRNTVREQSTPA